MPAPDPTQLARALAAEKEAHAASLLKSAALIRAMLASDTPAADWKPSDFQTLILDALKNKSLPASALAKACGCHRCTLYKKRGLTELMDRGDVGMHPEHGYYRPDFPPPQLTP